MTVFTSTHRSVRRGALWAAAVVWLTTVYFQQVMVGWNVASRFALTLALAERGTFTIDDYHATGWTSTRHKAFVDGHYYSDKSPVISLAAVPVVWTYRELAPRLGSPFRSDRALSIASWVVVGGAAAALAALLTIYFAERGLTPRRAAAAGAVWIAATPLLAYSLVFYDYLPACALFVASFVAARPSWRDGPPPTTRRLLAAGMLCGLACWTLNTLGLAAITLTALVSSGMLRRKAVREALMALLPWAAGGIIGSPGFFVYNYALFHSYRPAYAFEADDFFRQAMSHGLMGAGWPRPLVMWLQTLHPFQGLFLWFPVTAIATAGCIRLIAREGETMRREGLAALATFGLFLAYSSAYYMWWGGFTAYAPRHLLPGLSLLAIGLVPWLKEKKAEPWIWIVFALAVLFNLTTAAADPQYPVANERMFLQPDTALHAPIPMLEIERVFWSDPSSWKLMNVGRRLGLNGPLSLLPLLGVWGIALIALHRWVPRAA